MEITMKYNVTNQMIEDLIVTALEGGSNYWYLLTNESIKIIKDATPDMDGEPLAIRLTKALLMDDNIFVPIFDLENEKEELGKINQSSIKNALEKIGEIDFIDITNENIDATTADNFFQLAVMDEIAFG